MPGWQFETFNVIPFLNVLTFLIVLTVLTFHLLGSRAIESQNCGCPGIFMNCVPAQKTPWTKVETSQEFGQKKNRLCRRGVPP